MTANRVRLPPTVRSLLGSLAAVAAALVVGGLFLTLRGRDAFAAFSLLVERGLSPTGLTETLIASAPLLLVGSGLVVALRAGVWNVGVDGQLLVGALLAGVVGAALAPTVPPPAMWLVAAAAGVLGGLGWALLPALLKVRWGTNEIITTLMMNYVAINLTSWLVKGPAKDPAVVPPQTRLIPPAARLPDLFGSGVHLGFLVGIVGAIGVAVLFRITVAGFRLDTLGRNRRAAVHAGMPIDRLAVGALLASGALAGLAGANDVLGVKGLFQGNWNPAYGFAAFALVALARLDGFWLIPFAWLLALLAVGGESMTRPLAIPTSFVALLEGLVLLFFGLALALERRGVRRAGEIPAGSPTEMEPSSEPGTPPPSVTQAATEATPR